MTARGGLNYFVANQTRDRVQGSWLHPGDREMSGALESGDVPNYLVDLVILEFIVDTI